jgi:pyruvate,water dikinase
VVVAANRALQRVDPASLDDDGLAQHFRDVVDNLARSGPLHFEHTGFDVIGGHLFTAAADWGIEPEAMADLLAGASPASAEVDHQIGAIADSLDEAGAPRPVASLADIRSAGAAAAAALDAYLDDYGWRPVAAHDLLDPTVGERPEIVVAAVNAARNRRGRLARPDAVDAVRARVPATDRARFDELVRDARASYALRDDDVGVCWNWPVGLIRRAGLEAGHRVAGHGRLDEPLHFFEADTDEASALLVGAGPPGAELAGRWRTRERAAAVDPPQHLAGGGSVPESDPLPPAVARLVGIRNALWSLQPTRTEAPLHGLGIGTETATGPAFLVRDPNDLSNLSEGDVLVTVATTTAFNAVFPLLAAVVTEEGGLFSHTAILSRELGLTAVVGAPGALDAIGDGDIVEVDPVVGSVRVVERAT